MSETEPIIANSTLARISTQYNGAARETQINQRTISNNQEIFETISLELRKATKEILVVAAWFTDPVLLGILKEKADAGLNVQIILSDNEDNQKLDFDSFPDAPANVLKVKNVGYGMMHQKYCIIDRQVAIHGSYNWTVNAKKNNHESVIITNHKQTVDELVRNFEDIKHRLGEINRLGLTDAKSIRKHFGETAMSDTPTEALVKEEDPQEAIKSRNREYEKVLDTMIAAEISQFDRTHIKSQGYKRAKSTNGDYQVLPNAFDSIYSAFVSEIDMLDDKKSRLLNRIEEQRRKNLLSIKEKLELDTNSIHIKYDSRKDALTTQVANTKSQVEINLSQIEKLKNHNIGQLDEKIANFREEINAEEREFVKPAFRWFEFVPAVVINIGLFLYLILFYSSAAYILMFSELDAKEAKMNGVSILPPEVFNPNALSMAVEKGGTAIPFILLFVFVPMTLSVIGKLLDSKRILNRVLIYSGMLVVDAFIAYVVSKSIHEVEYLSGNVDEVWNVRMILENPNFYLVFLMGALGLILFKFAFDKLIRIFEDRNPQIAALRSKMAMEQLHKKIDELAGRKMEVSEEMHELCQHNIELQKEIATCEHDLNQLPDKRESELNRRRSETAIASEGITRITDVYVSHIENDNYLISLHALKDRIATFLEGWVEYLYEEYSIAKATNLSRLSGEVVLNWQTEKFASNNLDNRITLNE